MKNKKNIIKFIGFLSLCIGCFNLSFTSATNFFIKLPEKVTNIISEDYITEKIAPIHFADNGNDFGGLLYFSSELSGGLTADSDISNFSYSIKTKNSHVLCSQRVDGFYYNAERGERLRPLNSSYRSRVMTGLITTGGLYFNCYDKTKLESLQKCQKLEDLSSKQTCINDALSNNTNNDNYEFYGNIEQYYSGQNMNLIVGVNYNKKSYFIEMSGNNNNGPKLTSTFIRLGNKYPLGFVYDYNGGVGLVGCKIIKNGTTNSNGYLRNLVKRAQEDGFGSMFTVGDNGIIYTGENLNNPPFGYVTCTGISLEDTILNFVVEGIMGMSNSNNSTYGAMFNWSDKKMQGFSTQSVNNSTVLNHAKKRAETLCRGKWGSGSNSTNNGKIVCIANSSVMINGDNYRNKTLIVKNGNVGISIDSTGYDIFIDNGNLIINENATGKNVFTKDGLLTGTSVDIFNSSVESQIENSGTYTGDYVAVGSYIKGNFIVDGHVKSSKSDEKLHNKYFVYGKFITKDTPNDIETTFTWRCPYGLTNEEPSNYCPKSTNDRKNRYQNASLVIIDQYFDSPLLK